MYLNDHALWISVREGQLETATFLLQRGAIALNDFLATAVEQGEDAIADLLRAHGAV